MFKSLDMLKLRLLVLPLLLFSTCLPAQAPNPSILKQKAPSVFQAVFTTTKGDFTIEAIRKWSPLGVDRLYQLIKSGFFTNALLFRVEPEYVTQFGISENYEANRFWDPKKLSDEPMLQKNKRGMISFARDGKNNRATQLFINNRDNAKLDILDKGGLVGFTPIAHVIKGMEVTDKFYAGYGRRPAQIQDSLYKYGNRYFEQNFPGLDKILRVRIVK